MKRVVSVSLGSSRRDHSVETKFGNTSFSIERIGTNGNLEKAGQLISFLDGRVNAIGLGGIDLFLKAGSHKYTLREAKKLANCSVGTPVVDGSGLKETLERKIVADLFAQGILEPGQKVLMVCAMDRFGMAEAFIKHGCSVVLGDLLFSLGIDLPIYKLETLAKLARLFAPVVCQLPIKMLYPTGNTQEKQKPKFIKYFQQADIVAGDFHFIRRNMPGQLTGKTVITNTVTQEDLNILRQRGVKRLITTTPELSGRSFGTNVLEGVFVTLAGKKPQNMTSEDYEYWIENLQLRPRIEEFQQVIEAYRPIAGQPGAIVEAIHSGQVG